MVVTKVKSKTKLKKHSNKFSKNGKNKSIKRNMSKREKSMRGGSRYMRNANSIAAFYRKSKHEAELAVRRQLQEEIRQKRLAAIQNLNKFGSYMEVSDVEEPNLKSVYQESPVSPSGYLKIGAKAKHPSSFTGKSNRYKPGSEAGSFKIHSL